MDLPNDIPDPPMFYDREGRPISMRRWATIIAGNPQAKIVQQDVSDDGHYWVSTVWLGHNHSFMPWGPPIIFETMVFLRTTDDGEADMGGEVHMDRYSTEAQARAGHARILTAVNDGSLFQEEDSVRRPGSIPE